jgi:putative PIG3 family NAD(P)H quinone oxidoreductase
MRQVRFHGAGGPEVIGVETAPVPAPGPGQVLIAVTAAGVNRPDCLQRAGKYPPPPGATDVPGLEVSGTVTVLGPGVSSLAEGDQACALVASGGYAEFCVADEALCLPVPASIPLIEAGGIPETFFTVYDNLFTRGRLIPGEIVLVHGGSSGIGSTAIQLAREAGATVYATAGSAAKCSFCLSLGASAAFNHREQDFVAEVKALTGGTGVDVILDMVGGPYVDRNLKCLRTDGRLVQIAFLQGSRVDIDMTPIMVRRLTVTGSTLRPRSVALKAEIAKALRQRVWPWLEHGAVRPVIDCVMPLSEARAAHELMESGRHMGKIVLSTGRA